MSSVFLSPVHTGDKIDSTRSILSPVDKISRAGDKIDCTFDFVANIDHAVDFVACTADFVDLKGYKWYLTIYTYPAGFKNRKPVQPYYQHSYCKPSSFHLVVYMFNCLTGFGC